MLQPRSKSSSLILRAFWKAYRLSYEDPKRRNLRRRMLQLPAISLTNESPYSVHSLICSRDCEMLVCSLRSFMAMTADNRYQFIFHDDGSLTDRDAAFLAEKLPNTTLVRRSVADERARDEFGGNSRIVEFRQHQIMALKLVDVRLWAKGQRTAYIDSDQLFFSCPQALISALDAAESKNFFSRDHADAYIAPREEIRGELDHEPQAEINAGLWAMNTADIQLDLVEDWLKQPIFNREPFHYRLEQTFVSLLANISKGGAHYFPEEYRVDFHKTPPSCCVKHYVGRIRHGFELEGIAYLLAQGFEQRWHDFAKQARMQATR